MPTPPDITNFLLQSIEPAGALGFAYGLVRGAAALEKDASDDAIKYVSDLLLNKDARNLNELTATLVPTIFDKVFGPKPLAIRFAVRSILATTIFWFVLLAAKHAHWAFVWDWIQNFDNLGPITYITLLAVAYFTDWLCLIKASFLLKFMSKRFNVATLLLFFFLDITASYALSFLLQFIVLCVVSGMPFVDWARYYFTLGPIAVYFTGDPSRLELTSVVIPSTLLTSAWTFFVFLSCIFTRLLIPIDGLRRFTKWSFRDPDKRPLTAIAKVAAALVLLGGAVIKITEFI